MPRAIRSTSKSPFHRVWTFVGVLLLIAVSVPTFIAALHGETASAQSAAGSENTLLVNVITNLDQKIDMLSSQISALRSTIGSASPSVPDSTSRVDDGMSQCLTTCRTQLASCLTASATGTVFGATTGGGLDACRSQASTCMSQCRPSTTPTLACQDRCAVSFGACIVSAKGDAKKLSACWDQDRRCLIAACRPGSPTDVRSLQRVPSTVCSDQCDRDLAICSRAAAYDSVQAAACLETANTCRSQVCLIASSSPSNASGITPLSPSARLPSATPPGQQTTVVCENSCTAKFDDCTAKAGSNSAQLSQCNSTYGDCRNQCLTLIGGGY